MANPEWFNPEAIRGDIEKTITNGFRPKVHNQISVYQPGDFVRLDDIVYEALNKNTVSIPPSADWSTKGPVYPIVYENIDSMFGDNGSIRVQISWGNTSDESIGCNNTYLRMITGVLSTWVITPRNKGTKPGLLASMRLREIFSKWNRLGTCGSEIKISAINGPRSVTPNPGDNHFTHILLGTLMAMEKAPRLR